MELSHALVVFLILAVGVVVFWRWREAKKRPVDTSKPPASPEDRRGV